MGRAVFISTVTPPLHTEIMDAQLHLIPASELPAERVATPEGERRRSDWRLDPTTKEVGLRGVQQARAALRSAMRQRHIGSDDAHASAA